MGPAGSIPLILAVVAGVAQAEPRGVPLTECGRRVLARCDQIVEARVLAVNRAFRGVNTAQLEVTERLSGFDRSGTLLLMYVEDFAAPDTMAATLETSSLRYERARQAGLKKYLEDIASGRVPRAEETISGPAKVETKRETAKEPDGGGAGGAAGVLLAKGERGLFFLSRHEASYSLVGLISARDPLFPSKRERLLEVLRIEALPTLEEKADAAKRFYLRGLEERDPWQRGNSAREILGLAQRLPGRFTDEDKRRISTILFAESETLIQPTLERALRLLDPAIASRFAEKAEIDERERLKVELSDAARSLEGVKSPEVRAADLIRAARAYGRAATSLLCGFLSDPEPLVREAAAQALAEQGGPSCLAPLRRALEQERVPETAGALVYACGVRSDPEAVDLIVARLREPTCERAAIHALARIGTPRAREALLRRRGATADPETRKLIDALLAEEFGG